MQTETKAESKYVEVAIASIIAKVKRDQEIKKIAKKYPQYEWEKHNGYPQKSHKEAIKKFGYIEGIHRKSWKIT
jgi:ribonuclease HII